MLSSQPTETIGEYRLLTKIGEGGMGVVHLAQDPRGREVAIKLLRPHVIGDQRGRERLAREVTSLRRVRSPRVAEVYDADPWGDTPYVVTRYVRGENLHDHITRHGPLQGSQLHDFALGLAEALVAVHEVDVMHRDVKPTNILVEDGKPVLIDFGLAQLSDDSKLTHTGWLMGTPGYLAPEILYGDDPTPAADTHSWAACVAFAGTGRPPYGKGPAVAIMDRVRRAEHDLTGLPDALHWIISRALMPDPQDRPRPGQLVDWLSGAGAPRLWAAGLGDAEARTQVVSRAAPPGTEQPGMPPQAAPVSPVSPAPPARSPELRYAEPARPASGGTQTGTLDPGWGSDEEEPPAPRRAGRFVRFLWWLGVLALVVVGAIAAPVVAACAVFVAAWLTRSLTMRTRVLDRWRARRGPRRTDAALATLSMPWLMLRALPTALVNVGVAALDGAVVVVGMTLALDAGWLSWTLAAGGFVTGFFVWFGPLSRSVRAGARQVSSTVVRPGARGLVALFLVLAAVGGVVLWWRVAGPTYAPLPAPPWAETLKDLVR
ncbi:MAG: protein kinase domain-containing protein [Nocardioidaceae bacterium]